MNDEAIEQEIVAKGKTAPRVTPSDLYANIAACHYFTAADGVAGATLDAKGADVVDGKIVVSMPAELRLLTFCVLTLRNGFTVTGESACASPENFDAEIGRKVARDNAVQKIWPLMGYALKEQLARDATRCEAAATISHQPGPFAAFAPHQQRVLDEKADLDGKLAKLLACFDTTIFASLDAEEQDRMREQAVIMQEYSDVLGARIAAFTLDAESAAA